MSWLGAQRHLSALANSSSGDATRLDIVMPIGWTSPNLSLGSDVGPGFKALDSLDSR